MAGYRQENAGSVRGVALRVTRLAIDGTPDVGATSGIGYVVFDGTKIVK